METSFRSVRTESKDFSEDRDSTQPLRPTAKGGSIARLLHPHGPAAHQSAGRLSLARLNRNSMPGFCQKMSLAALGHHRNFVGHQTRIGYSPSRFSLEGRPDTLGRSGEYCPKPVRELPPIRGFFWEDLEEGGLPIRDFVIKRNGFGASLGRSHSKYSICPRSSVG